MIKKVSVWFLLVVCLGGTLPVFAQAPDSLYVQFSGVVVTADSLQPVPFVNIIIEGTYRGSMSDLGGFFSIIARKNETISFSSVGFKTVVYHVPDTLTKDRYTLIQIMRA